jgi:SAM-dependent methyltransferase
VTITPDALNFLMSPAGQRLLQQLSSEDLREANTLRLLTRLRKDYSQAGAALEMARLRLKAAAKFGENAAQMLFTRDALEQASDPCIRRYRAQHVRGNVLDVCCGIGSDALTFAAYGAQVTGIDLDPVRIAIAQYNAAVLDLSARFEVADARDITPANADLIFFDPARRSDDRRIYDVEGYIPPLSLVKRWNAPHIMAKLSPGVDLDQLESYSAEVEFISVEGDLKEAVLHLRSETIPPVTSATLIMPDAVYHWKREREPEERPLSPPLAWLIEPDPALIRAGLVKDTAEALHGYQLDDTIAYLTADTLPQLPWVRAWRVLDWMPFHLKRLRAHLRESNVGRVTVKKRGSPLTPEGLIAQLKLKGGGEARTLVLTRYQGDPIVIVCEEMPDGARSTPAPIEED